MALRLGQYGGFGRPGAFGSPGVAGGPGPVPPYGGGANTDMYGVLGGPPPVNPGGYVNGFPPPSQNLGPPLGGPQRIGGGSAFDAPRLPPPRLGGGALNRGQGGGWGFSRGSLPGVAAGEPYDPSQTNVPAGAIDTFEQPYMTPGIRVLGGLRQGARMNLGGPQAGGFVNPRSAYAGGGNSGAADAGVNGPGFPAFGTRGGSRPVGSPNVAGEMKGINMGGISRFNVPIDPRTGRPARGAADVLASMSASGWKPANDPNFSFSFDQATAMKADAVRQLQEADARGELNPMDKWILDNYLAGGDPGQSPWAQAMYNSDYGNPLYNFDSEGNPTSDPQAGGFDSRGWDPEDRRAGEYLPRMSGGLEPGAGDVADGSLAYRKWFKGKYGYDPDPVDDNGNPRPAI